MVLPPASPRDITMHTYLYTCLHVYAYILYATLRTHGGNIRGGNVLEVKCPGECPRENVLDHVPLSLGCRYFFKNNLSRSVSRWRIQLSSSCHGNILTC